MPLLIYDGDCGFCRRCVERWRRITRERVRYAPYQEVAHEFPDIPVRNFEEAVHLMETDKVSRGAEAVFRVMRYGGKRLPLFLYLSVPGFSAISEYIYRMIARSRRRAICTVPQK